MLMLAIVILSFLAGMLLVLGLAAPAVDRQTLTQRLESVARRTQPDAAPSLADAELEASLRERLLRPALRRLVGLSLRLTPRGATESTRAALDQAGRVARLGAAEFNGLRLLSLLCFCVIALVAARSLTVGPLLKAILFIVSLMIGAAWPDAWLQRRIAGRQRQMRKSLPDIIDLLVVSVEAGMGFDGAMARVVDKVHGPLSEEFGRVLQEMRLGKTRGQALKDMAARVRLPEVRTFVAAVYQADQLGVSISGVLRIQSETLRVIRMQRIRETAAKLPVKMLFPLIFFIFPAIFVVLIGPALLNLMKAFAGF